MQKLIGMSQLQKDVSKSILIHFNQWFVDLY